ncbi:hypothetical protein LJC74_06720 [Eubacteriales bacterium OttesenSCG-928-A19]|nr:hypothetical protein [Eubacteriales bacterium OttesenSCG-928-A19]
MDKDKSFQVSNSSVFDMYLSTIKTCRTAAAAKELACSFYEMEFAEPDIFMVGDKTTSYFIEAYGGKVVCIERKNGFFASTNHFRMIYGGVPYNKNHSTFLRLNRAEQILQSKPDLDGTGDVLRDKYYGETVWSVCRYPKYAVAGAEEAYYTQAAVIFTMTNTTIVCEYVLNGNASVPRVGMRWEPFASERPPARVEYIGRLSNLKI